MVNAIACRATRLRLRAPCDGQDSPQGMLRDRDAEDPSREVYEEVEVVKVLEMTGVDVTARQCLYSSSDTPDWPVQSHPRGRNGAEPTHRFMAIPFRVHPTAIALDRHAGIALVRH